MTRGEIMRRNSCPFSLSTVHPLGIRRNALAYIFQDQHPEDVQHIKERSQYMRSMSLCVDMETDVLIRIGRNGCDVSGVEHSGEKINNGVSQHEYKYEGVFQGMLGNDFMSSVSHLISNQEDTVKSCNDDMLDELEQVHDNSGSGHTTKRRFALADIFQNVDQEDIVNILSLYSRLDCNTEMPGLQRQRRNGIPDILERLTEEDRYELLRTFNQLHGCLEDDVEEENVEDVVFRKSRRVALANIFDDVSLEERNNFLNSHEYESEYESANDLLNSHEYEPEYESANENERMEPYCASRRSALPDIFATVNQLDLDNLLAKFSQHSTET